MCGSEERDIPMPSEKPLAKRRRLAAARVREARERLTSTTGTSVAFDYELLRQFAENRLSASLVIVLLWVYYSAQILFFGAQFTRACALRFSSKPEPIHGAEFVSVSANWQTVDRET